MTNFFELEYYEDIENTGSFPQLIIKEVFYLHQLQNIFFFIEGNELPIKLEDGGILKAVQVLLSLNF